jgi:hypothetical protein
MFQEDECPIISISHDSTGYDAGWINGERQAPISIRCALWDKTIEDDGRVASYRSVLDADALGMAIVETLRAAANYGDDVTAIQYRIDSTQWPYVEIVLDITIAWPVCLAKEATI